MAAPALTTPVPPGSALGMLETVGLVAAIEAADAMLKAADVALVRQQRVVPGLITHFVVGETAAVRSAVDAGAAAAGRVGKVAGSHVIPRPADDVWRRLLGVALSSDAPPAGAPASPKPADAAPPPAPAPPRAASAPAPPAVPATAPPSRDYAAMTVRELRALARSRDDLDVRGRAVASASKGDLVDALRRADAAT